MTECRDATASARDGRTTTLSLRAWAHRSRRVRHLAAVHDAALTAADSMELTDELQDALNRTNAWSKP